MAFVNASIGLGQTDNVIWTFRYGFDEYGSGWKNALGYVIDSPGTGALLFVLLAAICVLYRNRPRGEE